MSVRFFGKKKSNLKKLIHEKTGEKRQIRHIQMETGELFLTQRKNETFNRYDVIVRYLAVENYYNRNLYGFALYRKMQELRNPNDDLDEYEEKFRKLIASFENNGYSCESEVDVDEDLQIEDGAHRLSLALYWGINTLNVQVFPKKGGTIYSLEWFRLNGFSEEECNYLLEKEKELKDRYNEPLSIVLWPHMNPYFDEIESRIGYIGKIQEVGELCLEKRDFLKKIKELGYIESTEMYEEMEQRNKDDEKDVIIRILRVKLNSPQFKLKDNGDGIMLIQAGWISSALHKYYSIRVGRNNPFSNIICIADNYAISRRITTWFDN